MSQYSSWSDVKRRMRERSPDVTDAEWAERKRAAQLATESYALDHQRRESAGREGLLRSDSDDNHA